MTTTLAESARREGGPNAFSVLMADHTGLEHRHSYGGSTVWVDPDQAAGPGDLVLVRLPHGEHVCPFEHQPVGSELMGRVTTSWVEVDQ